MKLVVETLKDELYQDINYDGERVSIGAFIPYLYCHNVSGTFTFEVESLTETILSQSFTISEIKTALNTTENYFHVYFPIMPVNPMQLESGAYRFKLIAPGGYSATQNSFIGWIQQHEDLQNVMDYEPSNDSENSFCIRFKVYKEGINV